MRLTGLEWAHPDSATIAVSLLSKQQRWLPLAVTSLLPSTLPNPTPPHAPQSPLAQERNQLAWLAFGGGPRACIGYKFAFNEAKTVLVTLWQHYDFILDTSKTAVPPLLRPGITLGYREGLYFKVTPRGHGHDKGAAGGSRGAEQQQQQQ